MIADAAVETSPTTYRSVGCWRGGGEEALSAPPRFCCIVSPFTSVTDRFTDCDINTNNTSFIKEVGIHS